MVITTEERTETHYKRIPEPTLADFRTWLFSEAAPMLFYTGRASQSCPVAQFLRYYYKLPQATCSWGDWFAGEDVASHVGPLPLDFKMLTRMFDICYKSDDTAGSFSVSRENIRTIFTEKGGQ